MPKIVVMNKEVQRGVIIRNFMAGGQDVFDKELWVGDDLANFPYFNPAEKKIEVVDAKLVDVTMVPIGSTGTSSGKPGSSSSGKCPGVVTTAAALPENDNKYSVESKMKVESITIDASKVRESHLITVPQDCILEYSHGKSADDATAIPMLKLKLNLLLSDNNKQELTIEEGDIFSALIYRTIPEPKIVIGTFTVKGFVIEGANNDVTGLILDNDGVVTSVALEDIKFFGMEATMLSDMSAAKTQIENSKTSSETPTIIGLTKPGLIEGDTLGVGNVVQISGVKVGIPANTGDRANETVDSETENVIEGKIDAEIGTNILLDGLTFDKKANISFKGDVGGASIQNCKFVGLTPTETREYLIHTPSSSTDWNEGNTGANGKAALINIDGCYFGKTDNSGTNKIYNMIEIVRPWANGSSVSNCRFAGTCTNNYINIYNMEDGAVINLENDSVDEAIAFLRIAASKAPKNVVINIKNLKYDSFDLKAHQSNDTYGAVTIQPNKDIESMAGITINIDGFAAPDGDPKHLYSIIVNKDYSAKFNGVDKYPKIYINGKLEQTYHVINM